MRITSTLLFALLAAAPQAQTLTQIWQSPIIDQAEFSASNKYIVLTKNGTGPQVFAAEDFRKLAEWPGIKAALSGDTLLQLRDNQFQGYSEKAKRLGRQWKWPAPEGVIWMTLDGDKLFFADPKGVHRMSTTTGEIEQTRENLIGNPGIATANRFYVSDSHEVFGLDKEDLSKGWRYYCDVTQMGADQQGVYGTSWNWNGIAIQADGNSAGPRTPNPYFWTYDREVPAAIGNTVFFTASYGKREAGAIHMFGKYLTAFDRTSGNLLWKLSLNARSVVSHEQNIACLATSRDGTTRLQFRSSKDGTLLDQGKPFITPTGVTSPIIVSAINRLFLIQYLPEQKMQITAYK